MDSKEISNTLGLILAVTWAFKIGYHFNYFKAIDPTIKENNFFTFYLNFGNLRRSLLIVLPVFFSSPGDKKGDYQQRLARKALVTTLLLWGWIVTMSFYIASHPPEKAGKPLLFHNGGCRELPVTTAPRPTAWDPPAGGLPTQT